MRQRFKQWELVLIGELYPHLATKKIAAMIGRTLSSVYQAARKLDLEKTEEYLASPDACRLRRDFTPASIACRFKKGIVPHNKGRKMPGYAAGRMAETQFKKGVRPHSWKPIGSTRLCDGYLQRKITDTGYPPRDWKPVHVMLWEEHYGPIPEKHTVCFIDGDKTHIEIANLELVSRADLMKRNTLHNLPPEMVEVIQLRGVLNRQINKRAKESE